MRKALFITPILPSATGTGKARRAYLWLQCLKDDYEIEILLAKPDKLSESNMPYNISCTLNKAPKSKLALLLNVLFSSESLKYLYALLVPGWFNLSLQHKQQLYACYKDQKFDKIVCFRLYLAEVALYVNQLTHVEELDLDSDDIESSTWASIGQLMLKNGRYKKGLHYSFVAGQFKRLEGYYIKHFTQVYLCSEHDRQVMLKRFPQKVITVMANRVLHLPAAIKPCGDKKVLFVGSLTYYPNEEAVIWFARHVLPLLRNADASWHFYVAGFSPSPSLKAKLNEYQGLTLLDDLKNITDAYAQTSIVVAPLHAGGGTKIKVIEAMLQHRPVIATGEAVRGLGLVPDIHYLAAEKPHEFFERILVLNNSPEKYSDITAQAYQLATRNYAYSNADSISN